MHPEIRAGEPARCPICGMDLVASKPDVDLGTALSRNQHEDVQPRNQDKQSVPAEEPRHIHTTTPGSGYVCPMHPEIRADKPARCPICGMDLVTSESDIDPDRASSRSRHEDVQLSPYVINTLGVRLGLVERTDLVRSIELPGFVQQIRAGQQTRYRALTPGKVVALNVEPGQWVEKGTHLFDFTSQELEAAQRWHLERLVESEVSTTQVEGRDSSNPDSDTAEQDAASVLELSRRRLQALGLPAELIQRLERKRELIKVIKHHAPHAGRVMNLTIAGPADLNKGESIFTLGGLVRATVLANAFQRDARWIQNGQPAEISIPGEAGRVWPGVVNQGAVSINPTSQNIGVRLSFSAPLDRVRSSMYVETRILGEVRRGALTVPTAAVIYDERQARVVRALGDGRFHPVEIRTGLEVGDVTEVLEGLKEGERVVTSAQFLIDSESNLNLALQRLGRDATP
jgi:membrane fusion protein, copper/silver efflux system